MSNEIVTGIGPKNTTQKLWKVTSIGGWEGDHNLAVDISKRYIVFIWIYKEALVDTDPCTISFGIDGNVLNNEIGSAVSSPYFVLSENWVGETILNGYIGEWLLCVGNIFPSTTENNPITYSGIYDLSGERIVEGIDYRWSADPSLWDGERIIQDNESNEVLIIAKPAIYQFDENKGPFIENILGI